MGNFKNYKNRLLAGVATGFVSLCLTGTGASNGFAQSAEPRVLPPVSVDAPRQRAQTTRTSRPRTTSQRAARAVPRRAEQPPAPTAPVSTMGSTRTIGAPAPAYAGGQVAQGGTLGLLGSTSVMNTPFSTVNYTSKLIEDQQARTAADTLINDSSVRLTTGSNGFDDTFQIRGFSVPAGDVGFNGLYGLMAPNHVPAQLVERIELLKGPGALINGMAPSGSVGGGINIVSKRALEDPFTRLTPMFLSSGNYGLHIDTSRRFGDNKEWGVRFNGVGRNGEASIDGGNWRSGLGALSLDYRGERLRWTLDAISQNDDTKNFRPQMTIQGTVPFIPAPPDSRGNWYPGTRLKQSDNTIASGIEYDLTDWLTAYAGVGYRDGRGEQNLADSRAGGTTGMNQFGNFNVFNAYYDFYNKTVSGNVGLRSEFNTGFIKHKLNVVYTGFNQETGYGYVTSVQSGSGYVPSNIYDPSPLPTIAGGRPPQGKSNDVTLRSVAIVDTMSFLNDAILVTAGVRRQNVKQDPYNYLTGLPTGNGYDSSATTPLGGVVIKPWHNVSFYANYAEGLSQGTNVPMGQGFANEGTVLAPYKSKQGEAGVKIDWGRVTTTAAVFQITRPSLITTPAMVRAYDGEQRNRGLELTAYGEILPGLRGMGSVTFMRPELTNPANAAERGNDAAGVPNRTLSAGLDWDTPWVEGLALNGRVIYTSGSYLTTANLLRYPDWTRVDIGARYKTAINGRPVTFRANIENLFDKTYWLTTGTFVTVGSPRTYLVSAAFDF
ncbi:ferrichrome receptor FcuA [Afipia carboxidovorans OM5]|uniref:TonB-dependent siderophore receptor n=1 Tax=Afipia carboxidovorans (strain ATCC 49405 / DSM 1227 / KCTC 32145 / OM5) TaxID=504832 RepID=B6JDF1_AFIC5|nr:TonB-dependent receptor [Afipia carboxidovorans]ACI91863.1 ferrichrome receptor FcuA [Afipia carboxidovorans OM5]AEI04275.1 TonB-dependent siderophore receptor [Afipia carboxidovorans OM4]AEI07905.1 TonB-dependent siderophore receptor [Afipia carboxidovorans OM5]